MSELDNLLNQGEPERIEKDKGYGLDSLHVTNYAFEKAYAYARLAVQKAGRTIECGGYLIAQKNTPDRIATDSFLARNQDVSDGLFTIEAENVIKAGREINKMGYRVLGWWHSHGLIKSGAFFSYIDNNGQRTVLNEIAAINYVTQKDEKDVGNLEVQVRNGKLIMFDKKSPERKYQINLKDKVSKKTIGGLTLIQDKKIGFAYGLVVTAHKRKRKPYAEIATRDLCGFCRNSKEESVVVNVKLYDKGDFVINEDVLRKEIEDRVNMRPKRIFSFGKGRDFLGRKTISTPQTPWAGQEGFNPGGDDSFYETELEERQDQKPEIVGPANVQDRKYNELLNDFEDEKDTTLGDGDGSE